LFKEAGKGKTISEKSFIKYLTDLPESTGHDELSSFSDERRLAVFKLIASSSKGVSKEDFTNIFKVKCQCIKPTVLTRELDLDDEKKEEQTVCKVSTQDVVETSGVPKKDKNGALRSEAKVGDQAGWITVKSGSGKYLAATSAFKAFKASMEKTVFESSSAISKVSTSLNNKLKQGGPAEDGSPLKEARDEMAKLKEEVIKAQKAMDEIKNEARKAQSAFQDKEQKEKNAHIEAKNAKEAAPFLEDPKAKMEALEADGKAADEAFAPMKTLSAEELKAFATPASVKDATEKLAASAKEKADALREAIKEQTQKVSEVKPQSGGTSEAKKQLKAMSLKCEEIERRMKQNKTTVTNKCNQLVSSLMDPVAEAIRKAATKAGKTIDEFFDSLKKGDKIPEDKFCKMLTGLEGHSLSEEIAQLVCRKLEADGISQETFKKYVVLYYKVVRTIAFTDKMDISACKTLRKGDEGEVVEVLEGPVTDEANGMTRIRAKSMKADDSTTGWITLSGSKGTAFLEKVKKP